MAKQKREAGVMGAIFERCWFSPDEGGRFSFFLYLSRDYSVYNTWMGGVTREVITVLDFGLDVKPTSSGVCQSLLWTKTKKNRKPNLSIFVKFWSKLNLYFLLKLK